MSGKQIDEIIKSVAVSFRTFGGGKDASKSGNPIAIALQNKPAQFAAGVDVRQVVLHILKLAKKKAGNQKQNET